ncbi:LysR family transcriptional regulator [Carnobacterium divergens]|uniref:LysR family transcriptional regulator n=1 Tax=Carnobacterium divergens TaxID=2748 RepID=UPI0007F4024B|nr:LysR family transcriptional regulator [Carnobacterium divergens]SBO18477.1 Bacterial regulatory helix-turn-helix, lysR family protein [Carnobacterium divergens]
MDFRQLNYFIAVAEEKTITAAAERLHMAQPPLSQQLKQMEEEFGTPLIERTPRQTRLTAAGTALYYEALKLVEQFAESKQLVRETGDGLKGQLKIGVNTLSDSLLAQALIDFQKDFPSVTFAIHQGESQQLCELVRKGKIELAIVRYPLDLKGFSMKFLKSEPFYFVCDGSAKKGPAPDDFHGIAGSKLMLPSTEGLGVYHSIIEYLAKYQLNPSSISTCSDIRLLFNLIEQGFCTSIVPETVLKMNPHYQVETHLLEDPLFQTSFGIIWLEERYLSKMATSFLDYLTIN